MARKTVTHYYSDLSGDEIESADTTISFGLEGVSYDVDLTANEQQELRDLLARYVEVARASDAESSRRRRRHASSQSGRGETSAKDIREWALANGYAVPDRGRIPALVREAFDAAR